MELKSPWAQLYFVAFGLHWLTGVLASSLFAALLSVCFVAALVTPLKAKISFKAIHQIPPCEQDCSILFTHNLEENFY
jgi:hypothetical protein